MDSTPDDASPSDCQSFIRAFEGNCFETTVGKVGCGQSLTINRSALFVTDHKTPDVVVSVATGLLKCRGLKYQICFFVVVFFPCSCRRLTSPACMGSGAAGPASQKKKKKRSLSDVTEKKPQQCALLSAPLRGVQQQSTSTELFCLILLCRLCLSFSQRLNTKALPQR